jgi:hypothetical protein
MKKMPEPSPPRALKIPEYKLITYPSMRPMENVLPMMRER